MTRYYRVGQESGNHVLLTVAPGQALEIQDDAGNQEVHVELMLLADARAVYKGSFIVSAGAVKRTLTVQCAGAGSSATVVVSCLTSATATFSLQTQQRHSASGSTSTVRIHGVSGQTSRVSVDSNIYIAERVGGVEARQVHRHLLLDEGARATSVPSLDILSDDVSCSHGAAITHLDQTQLFYLNARGYDQDAAREAIIKAFLTL